MCSTSFSLSLEISLAEGSHEGWANWCRTLFFPLSGVTRRFVLLLIIGSVGRLQLELECGFPTPRRGTKGEYPFPGGAATVGPVAGRLSVGDAACPEG